MSRTCRTPARYSLPMLSLLLALAQTEAGFTSLFDGRTLAGWTERGGRYDGDADWRVEEGCLVGRQGPSGEGGLLYTEKSYTSFELRLEVWLDHPFDSGVFLRMLPPATGLKGAQVTLDWREGGEIGAIYADGFLLHNQEGAQRFRRDAWNDLRVRCTGFDMQIEVELNGQPLTRFEQPSDAPGYASVLPYSTSTQHEVAAPSTSVLHAKFFW